MFPPSETSRSSSTSSSRPDFITSLRRLASKSKRDVTPSHSEQYVPRPLRISSLTTETVTRALHSASISTTPSRRVRMSGSRLPSGYRANTPPKAPPQPALKSPIEPQPEPSVPTRISPPPLRSRITRLIIGHTPRAHSVSTPTSSTLSFPSSSHASTSTTASTSKTVRFSPSTSFERGIQLQKQSQRNVVSSEKVSRWKNISAVAPGREGTSQAER